MALERGPDTDSSPITSCRGADCATYIDAGEDLAYVGKVGSLKLDAGGDPTVATYKVSRFEGSELVEQITVFDLSR